MLLMSFEYLLKIVQMFLFWNPSNQYVINIADDMWQALQDGVHGPLVYMAGAEATPNGNLVNW